MGKKAKQWSTKEEWERTQQHVEERNQIQKNNKNGPDNPKTTTKITLTRMTNARMETSNHVHPKTKNK